MSREHRAQANLPGCIISKWCRSGIGNCSHVRHQGVYSPGESLFRMINLNRQLNAAPARLTDPSWVGK